MVDFGSVKHISARDFAKQYKSGRLFDHQVEIVDVREIEEWQRTHLEKSKLIPLGELIDRFQEIDRESVVYLICAHGVRSLYAARLLQEHGFLRVVNVDSGLAQVWLYLEEEHDQ